MNNVIHDITAHELVGVRPSETPIRISTLPFQAQICKYRRRVYLVLSNVDDFHWCTGHAIIVQGMCATPLAARSYLRRESLA